MFKWQFTSVGHTAEPGIHPHWCSQITTHLATCRCPEGRVTLFRWLHTRPLPATHASVGYRRRNGGFLRRDRLKQLLTRLHVAHMNASRLSKFSFVLTDRMGCSSISGLLAADTAAAGPYEIR